LLGLDLRAAVVAPLFAVLVARFALADPEG
jgi:hypothetical protein